MATDPFKINNKAKQEIQEWLENRVYALIKYCDIEMTFSFSNPNENCNIYQGIIVLTDKGFIMEREGIEYYLSEMTDFDANLILSQLPEFDKLIGIKMENETKQK